MAAAAEMAAAAFRSAELTEVICGDKRDSEDTSCLFLKSLNSALDRSISNNCGMDVIGKRAIGCVRYLNLSN